MSTDFSGTDLTQFSTQSLEAELARRNAAAGVNDGRTDTTEVRGEGSTAQVAGVPAGGSAAQTETTDAVKTNDATGATTSDVKLSEVPAPESTPASPLVAEGEKWVDEELSKVVNEILDHLVNYAVNPSALVRELSALKTRVFG